LMARPHMYATDPILSQFLAAGRAHWRPFVLFQSFQVSGPQGTAAPAAVSSHPCGSVTLESDRFCGDVIALNRKPDQLASKRFDNLSPAAIWRPEPLRPVFSTSALAGHSWSAAASVCSSPSRMSLDLTGGRNTLRLMPNRCTVAYVSCWRRPPVVAFL
jgi:hypothetical protein